MAQAIKAVVHRGESAYVAECVEIPVVTLECEPVHA